MFWTPIQPGDPRSSAALNTIWSAFATASGNVTAVNLAEEGLDARALEAHPVGRRTGMVKSATRNAATLPIALGYTQFSQNGVPFRLNAAGSVPASLAANELLRIRARTRLESTVANGLGLGGNGLTQFQFRVAWNDGASTLGFVGSDRVAVRASPADWGNDANLLAEGWLHGPIANIAWVEAQYTLAPAGSVAFPGASMLWATLFRRQNEV